VLNLFRQIRSRLGGRGPEVHPSVTRENVRITNPWHAVSIVPQAGACAAAQAIAGRRFLSSEQPPQLPLEGCTAAICTCHYAHHADRRVRRLDGATRAARSTHPRRRADD
jgi:hypothetical protein